MAYIYAEKPIWLTKLLDQEKEILQSWWYTFLRLLSLPPSTNAAAMIIRFLMMYCPSMVGNQGKASWKVTSGRKNNGIKVPTICINSRAMATLVALLNRKAMPMATSYQPITSTQADGSKNGNQATVASTRGMAAEVPKGFKIPNQMKITANEILKAGSLHCCILCATDLSSRSSVAFMVVCFWCSSKEQNRQQKNALKGK